MDCTSLVLLLSFLYLCLDAIRQLKNRLPPGPFPLPIVGNLFKLGDKPHESLAKLANLHGPLMTLKLGSVTAVVASSPEMAKEIVQKHDQALSGRTIPDAVRACKHHEYSMAWIPASAQWRDIKKFSTTQLFTAQRLEFNQHLRRQKVEQLVSYMEQRSKNNEAVAIAQVAFTTVLNLISNTVFSIDLTSLDSGYAQEFKALARGIMEEVGRPNFADYFPVLRPVDPQGIRRRMEGYFGKLNQLFSEMIKKRMESRKLDLSSPASKDVLDAMLDYKQEHGFKLTDPVIRSLLIDIFVAGTDTTSSTLEWAMTELLRHPDIMAKAKLELEEKLVKDKAIDESDIMSLPYLQAIVKETFRLHPPIPLLLPRRAESDVETCGYIVPKGTQVLINVWIIGRDPNIWENPTSFMPERFLNSSMDYRGRDLELIPFGAGRRICPGLPLAHRMLHLMLASLLHSFDWKLDGGLKPEDMNMEEKFGLTLQKAIPLKAIPIKL